MQGWASQGGSRIGTTRTLPSEVGISKVATKFAEHNINGLLIVGGFEAYRAILELAEARALHSSLCVPMVCIPATISNNVPGTDFSLGADTALNEIVDVRATHSHSSSQLNISRLFH